MEQLMLTVREKTPAEKLLALPDKPVAGQAEGLKQALKVLGGTELIFGLVDPRDGRLRAVTHALGPNLKMEGLAKRGNDEIRRFLAEVTPKRVELDRAPIGKCAETLRLWLEFARRHVEIIELGEDA